MKQTAVASKNEVSFLGKFPMHVIEDLWGMVRAGGSTRPTYDYLVKRAELKKREQAA
jgi:hypothetical protein